ncbi:MAG: methionyl-tRNA formyltransferase [Nitrospirae bacterium]|nr:methionyl-tRNA formyltransferase [Nitrospirota bacterium]
MRIVFFGTPEFAIPFLNTLLNSENEIVAVVTQPDKRAGRGRIIHPSPVKEIAMKNGIRIMQPQNIKDDNFIQELSNLKPEIITVVAYGKILPSQILHLPPLGCVNVHASLLPKYRGAAPIQWAIIKGESETGVTTMLMDEGLDTGKILLQEKTAITDQDNSETLSKRLSHIGASLLLKTIKRLKEGSIKAIPQEGIPTYAPPLKKEDGKINWTKTAKEIFNLIRGLYPWPCAYCYLNNERIKIISAKFLDGVGIPGRIEKSKKGELTIGTGRGLISIVELQPEGKRRMSVEAFLIGRKLEEGTSINES